MHFKHNIWHNVVLGKCSGIIVRVRSARRNSSPCSQSSCLQSFSNFNVHAYRLGQSCENADSNQKVGKELDILHF